MEFRKLLMNKSPEAVLRLLTCLLIPDNCQKSGNIYKILIQRGKKPSLLPVSIIRGLSLTPVLCMHTPQDPAGTTDE